MSQAPTRAQMAIPCSLREEAGIAERALLKVTVVKGGTKKLLRELAQAVDELREEAAAKGIDTMSTREIKAAVSAARTTPMKAAKRSPK